MTRSWPLLLLLLCACRPSMCTASCRCSCLDSPLPTGVPLGSLVAESPLCACPAACASRSKTVCNFTVEAARELTSGSHRMFGGAGNCRSTRCTHGRCLAAGGGCSSWRPFTVHVSAAEGAKVTVTWSMRSCTETWSADSDARSYFVHRPSGASNRSSIWLLPLDGQPGLYAESDGGCRFELHAKPAERNIVILGAVGGALGLYYIAVVVYSVVSGLRAPDEKSWSSPFTSAHRRCAPSVLVAAYAAVTLAMSLSVYYSILEGHDITTISSTGMYYPEHLFFVSGYSVLAPCMWFVISTYAARENVLSLFVLSLLHIPFLLLMAWTDGIASHGVHISGAIIAIALLHICCIIHTVIEFRKRPRKHALLLAWYVVTAALIPPFVVMWFTVSKVFEWLAVACLMLHYAPWIYLMFTWQPSENGGFSTDEEGPPNAKYAPL